MFQSLASKLPCNTATNQAQRELPKFRHTLRSLSKESDEQPSQNQQRFNSQEMDENQSNYYLGRQTGSPMLLPQTQMTQSGMNLLNVSNNHLTPIRHISGLRDVSEISPFYSRNSCNRSTPYEPVQRPFLPPRIFGREPCGGTQQSDQDKAKKLALQTLMLPQDQSRSFSARFLPDDCKVQIEEGPQSMIIRGQEQNKMTFVTDDLMCDFNQQMMLQQCDPDAYEAAPMPSYWQGHEDYEMEECQQMVGDAPVQKNAANITDTPLFSTVSNQKNLNQPSIDDSEQQLRRKSDVESRQLRFDHVNNGDSKVGSTIANAQTSQQEQNMQADDLNGTQCQPDIASETIISEVKEAPKSSLTNSSQDLASYEVQDVSMHTFRSQSSFRDIKKVAKSNTEYNSDILSNSNDTENLKIEDKINKMFGPISSTERMFKVRRYLFKKQNKFKVKKERYSYQCRRHVADKRLRIKGRFVTRDQAFQILGLKPEELLEHEELESLLAQHGESGLPISLTSLVENGSQGGGELIKIRNFQALISNANAKLSNTISNDNDSHNVAKRGYQEESQQNEDIDAPQRTLQLNMRISQNHSAALALLRNRLTSTDNMSRLQIMDSVLKPLFKIEKVPRKETVSQKEQSK